MKLGHRYLLLSFAVFSLQGCVVVPGRTVVHHTTDDVIVYTVNTPRPVRPARWRRSFQFVYYPSYQVYYAPHRNCYIWRGSRGWVTTPKPPPHVALNQADCVNIEIENDDPVTRHTQIESHVSRRPNAPPRRFQPVGRGPARQADHPVPAPAPAPDIDNDTVKVEGEVHVDDDNDKHDQQGQAKPENSEDRRDKLRDKDRGRGKDKDKDDDKGKGKGKGNG